MPAILVGDFILSLLLTALGITDDLAVVLKERMMFFDRLRLFVFFNGFLHGVLIIF